MYRSQEDRLKLSNLLPRLRGAKSAPYTPVVHRQSDKTAAKKVLERLLASASTNEILSIQEI